MKQRKGFSFVEIIISFILLAIVITGIMCSLSYIRECQVRVREYGHVQTICVGTMDEIQSDLNSGVNIAAQNYTREVDGVSVGVTVQEESAYGAPLYFVVMDLKGTGNVRIVTRTYLGGRLQ